MKNILVSGVCRGLGLEIVKSLLKKKTFCVYGFSRSKTKAFELLLEKYPDRLKWIYYDMSNIEDIRKKNI